MTISLLTWAFQLGLVEHLIKYLQKSPVLFLNSFWSLDSFFILIWKMFISLNISWRLKKHHSCQRSNKVDALLDIQLWILCSFPSFRFGWHLLMWLSRLHDKLSVCIFVCLLQVAAGVDTQSFQQQAGERGRHPTSPHSALQPLRPGWSGCRLVRTGQPRVQTDGWVLDDI